MDDFGVFFLVLVVVLPLAFLIYLIHRYRAYRKLERKEISPTEINFTQIDLIIAILFIWLTLVGAILSIPLLIKRHKIYKIYGEEIRKQKEEVNKERREKMLSDSPSTFRIIGKIAILLVVLGFFMPVVSLPLLGGQNGFELAEYATNINDLASSLGEKATNLATFLYVSFISALIGGSIIIPLVMKKRINIIFDLLPLVVSGICWFYVYSVIKDYVKLQIGGNFIFIGLIASFLITLIAIIKKEN